MNRRNLLKTLTGTVLTTVLPVPALAQDPWIESLKSQTDRLIKKWEPILDYTANDVPALPKHKWASLACLMEYREQQFLKEPNGMRLLKILIPLIRKTEGNVKFETITNNNQKQVVIYTKVDIMEWYYYQTHLVDGVWFCDKTNTITVTIS